MLAEANKANAFFNQKFGKGKHVPAGEYAVPTDTSRGDAFMKVIVSEDQYLSDFKLYWDENFQISWYTHKKDGTEI